VLKSNESSVIEIAFPLIIMILPYQSSFWENIMSLRYAIGRTIQHIITNLIQSLGFVFGIEFG
jgi:hypothetical protein